MKSDQQKSPTLTLALRDALWDSLAENPNDLDTLQLWLSRHGAAEGSETAKRALALVASLPQAWLAKIWTTRDLLARQRLNDAMAIYRDVLSRHIHEPLVIQEISGHLGEAGYYEEAVHLLLPRYVPSVHGPLAGLNLLHACEDAGDDDAGRLLAEKMLAAGFPGFRPLLWSFRERFGGRAPGDSADDCGRN
jgi:hypothetical protein